jgi:phosphoribosylanthranilate isomerase
MTLVKICGVNDAAAFDTAVAAGADFVGFAFYGASPRCVTPAQAAALSSRHKGGPRRVGLFVAPEADEIAAVLAAMKLDVLQLYVPAARAATLRTRFGLPVWRAVGVSARTDLPHDAGGADRLLIEAKAPAAASRPGGNAVAFDWSLLSGWTAPCPWVLAGGLTPDNVAAAIRATGAPAVDVSSGVERAPGVKDPALIRAFIAAARAA